MTVAAVVAMSVVLIGAGVTAVCVATVESESRRLGVARERLRATLAGSPAPGGSR